jgi:hypothetical protein
MGLVQGNPSLLKVALFPLGHCEGMGAAVDETVLEGNPEGNSFLLELQSEASGTHDL